MKKNKTIKKSGKKLSGKNLKNVKGGYAWGTSEHKAMMEVALKKQQKEQEAFKQVSDAIKRLSHLVGGNE
jgi:hypothetical protein